MSENSGAGAWVGIAVLALIYHFSNGSKAEESQRVSEELGVSSDEAAELLDTYGSADEAIESEEREPFDEDAAREAAEDELANEGYDYSYGCTVDCSGHEAGWQWRADHGYASQGTSQSFSEGGTAFDEALEERVREMQDEYEAGEDPY